MNPLFLTDGYKCGHHMQYPKGTTLVYSNFTPRSNKYAPNGCDQLVSFGQQMVMKQIHEAFENEFFSKPKDEVCGEMKLELSMYLGADYDVSHFEALHDLGYLPIAVKALPEGTLVPIKVPVLTIYNTNPDFYWVTNYLETILSNLLWKPMTSATIAHQYRKVLTKWQEKTDAERGWFIDWQGHDFSMRGMDSVEAVISSGLGHLTSFLGSDSLPTIYGARKFYGATDAVCGSVNATEHSVACSHMNIVDGKIDESSYIEHLLEIYPTGILSMVSDTFNLWDICTKYLPKYKEEIMARDGKLVIRPDSGDPVDILCGAYHTISSGDEQNLDHNYPKYGVEEGSPEYKGVIELLWDVFGGTINEQGYKVLDSHIGAIYGDSITIERADEICRRLEAKGFASTNIVLGVGSFTYQFNTRDTFGFAMKATYVEVNGEGREIFKDPITDDGVKKSAKGLLHVTKHNENGYMLVDKVSWETEANGELQTIYKDGQFENQTALTEIRERLKLA
jgi:nicotinamide phosphoribosyltransferase